MLIEPFQEEREKNCEKCQTLLERPIEPERNSRPKTPSDLNFDFDMNYVLANFIQRDTIWTDQKGATKRQFKKLPTQRDGKSTARFLLSPSLFISYSEFILWSERMAILSLSLFNLLSCVSVFGFHVFRAVAQLIIPVYPTYYYCCPIYSSSTLTLQTGNKGTPVNSFLQFSDHFSKNGHTGRRETTVPYK